jgi:hypothetical protein
MTMFPFDQNQQNVYQQYAQAADQGDYSQIDHYEAAGSLQSFAQNAAIRGRWRRASRR